MTSKKAYGKNWHYSEIIIFDFLWKWSFSESAGILHVRVYFYLKKWLNNSFQIDNRWKSNCYDKSLMFDFEQNRTFIKTSQETIIFLQICVHPNIKNMLA